jgi:hypothetical protein
MMVPLLVWAQTAPNSAPAPIPLTSAVTPQPSIGPKVQFGNPVYDFGRIKSGDVVKFAYYFTNVGAAELELSNVHPGCGCTAAGEWSRKVAPGGTGTIPIQFNSANFNGQIMKSVTVTCNDSSQPVHVLQLKGQVWKPVDVTPKFAVLNIPPDSSSASVTVSITNNMDEPLEVFSPSSNNRSISAEIITNTPGRSYQVRVKASQPLPPGNTQAQVELKTSSSLAPTVSVQVWANVQQAVMVMPPQVTLPTAPLQVRTMPSIMIQNYSTNSLQVTEPTLDLENVEVKLNEIQAGRSFSVSLAFPPGFELPSANAAQLTVKTSHPQYPLLKIPINQLPRTMAPGGAPAVSPRLAPPISSGQQ